MASIGGEHAWPVGEGGVVGIGGDERRKGSRLVVVIYVGGGWGCEVGLRVLGGFRSSGSRRRAGGTGNESVAAAAAAMAAVIQCTSTANPGEQSTIVNWYNNRGEHGLMKTDGVLVCCAAVVHGVSVGDMATVGGHSSRKTDGTLNSGENFNRGKSAQERNRDASTLCD